MTGGTSDLFNAVAIACGHDLKVSEFNDRLTLQKGCYILNSWGYGPKYPFNMYIRGPYSSELAGEYYKYGVITRGKTGVPEDALSKLAEIYSKGIGYAEAYATVLMIKTNSKGASSEDVLKRAMDLKPRLKAEVAEAAACLLGRDTSIPAVSFG